MQMHRHGWPDLHAEDFHQHDAFYPQEAVDEADLRNAAIEEVGTS